MAPILILFLWVAFVFYALLRYLKSSNGAPKSARPIPGPKPKPLVGNALDIPTTFPWIKLYEWGKTYGPLYRFSAFGSDTYVISSEKVANDLIRDRGAIYSSRPLLPASRMLFGNDQFPVLLPADPALPEKTSIWRKGRKFTHQMIGFSSMPKFSKTHDLESAILAHDLIGSPADYETIFERYAAGIVFRLGFGIPVETGREYYVRKAVEMFHIFEKTVIPGAYLVDIFPSMMKIPTFMAPFKKYLLAKRHECDEFFLELQNMVRQPWKQGIAPPSMTKTFLDNQEKIGLSDLDGAHLIGGLYGAGVGSTSAMLIIIIHKFVLHPEWLKRAHEELDEKVGDSRLPEFEDIPNLPTVRAVIKEVLRLSVPGIPHQLIKNDTYDGYFLPAGATVLPNLWAINRDPEVYPDPETFNPDRWLSPKYPTYREPLDKYPNLQQYTSFGFGRRICPGMSLAERSLNIAVARIAWACDISKKIGPDGKEIYVAPNDYTSELVSKPKPFQFHLQARDAGRMKGLEEHLDSAKEADPLKERTSYELGEDEA